LLGLRHGGCCARRRCWGDGAVCAGAGRVLCRGRSQRRGEGDGRGGSPIGGARERTIGWRATVRARGAMQGLQGRGVGARQAATATHSSIAPRPQACILLPALPSISAAPCQPAAAPPAPPEPLPASHSLPSQPASQPWQPARHP
jgi:hypothetical protein